MGEDKLCLPPLYLSSYISIYYYLMLSIYYFRCFHNYLFFSIIQFNSFVLDYLSSSIHFSQIFVSYLFFPSFLYLFIYIIFKYLNISFYLIKTFYLYIFSESVSLSRNFSVRNIISCHFLLGSDVTLFYYLIWLIFQSFLKSELFFF